MCSPWQDVFLPGFLFHILVVYIVDDYCILVCINITLTLIWYILDIKLRNEDIP